MRNRIDPSEVQVLYVLPPDVLYSYYTYLLHATAVERIPYVQNKSTVASMETKVETERFNEKDIEICNNSLMKENSGRNPSCEIEFKVFPLIK